MHISERIYRRLISLYPAKFLLEYREPLEQAFRDQMRNAVTVGRQVKQWARTLLDLARSLPSAWLAQLRPQPSKFAFENWNPQARRAVFFARMQAQRANSDTLTVEHLLAGLLTADAKLAEKLFPNASLRDIAAALCAPVQTASAAAGLQHKLRLPLDTSCKEVLSSIRTEIQAGRMNTAAPADLILAILRHSENAAAAFLRSRGVDEQTVQQAMPSSTSE
jgi:hypothetical protein